MIRTGLPIRTLAGNPARWIRVGREAAAEDGAARTSGSTIRTVTARPRVESPLRFIEISDQVRKP
jgi:hypothetical protein